MCQVRFCGVVRNNWERVVCALLVSGRVRMKEKIMMLNDTGKSCAAFFL